MNTLRNIIIAGLSSLLLLTLSSCGDKVSGNQIVDGVLSIGGSSSDDIKAVDREGQSFFLKITTPAEWSLSVEPASAKEWIKLDSWSGNGSAQMKPIRVDILENSQEKERTAELVLTSNGDYKKLLINQNGVKKVDPTPEDPDPEDPENPEDPTPQVGEVFLETFGTPEKVNDKWQNVNDYKGYVVKTNQYSDPFFNKYVKASVRKSSKLNGHVWLAAKGKYPSHTALKIEGFKTGTGLKLSFKLADNTGTLQANALKLSTDKGLVALPATQLKKNEYQVFTVTLPDNTKFIQFEADNLPDGVRIDDVKLVAGDVTGGGDDPNTGGDDPNTGGGDPNTGGGDDPNTGGGDDPNTGGGDDPSQGSTQKSKSELNGEHLVGDDLGLLELPELAGGKENYFATLKTSDGKVNYSLEFDVDKRHSRWVAFQFNNQNSAENVRRTNDWRWESKYIPRSFSTETYYKGSGYSRGHLVASHDRLQTREANQQTFNYFNMSPQIQIHNGGIWLKQEKIVQRWGRSRSFRDVLYVAKGGTIKDGQIKSHKLRGKMVIPEYYFMAIVVKKGSEYHGIAFWTEHRKYDKYTSLRSTSLSIDELEKKTGINFFCNFPDKIENKFEAETASSFNWPGL